MQKDRRVVPSDARHLYVGRADTCHEDHGTESDGGERYHHARFADRSPQSEYRLRHRWVLDALIDQDYAWMAVAELEGMCSAAGINGAEGDADVDEAPGWGERWPFAA